VIDDDALDVAIALTTRYVLTKFLPDKAIDVIDEAGARIGTT
jgi:ATP-dependent Clp protease ATP-binding subunit ClpC